MYEIYCKLKNLRGCKDSDVARVTGITRSTFSDWKKGKSTPKQDKLQKIAEYFNVSVDYLIGATDNPQRNEDKSLLHSVYFEYMREAQEKNIHPDELRLAIDIIQKIRG